MNSKYSNLLESGSLKVATLIPAISKRFTVVTYGTEGDTRPLVGLCRGLLNAGHEVYLFADRSTMTTAQAQEVSTQALSGGMKAAIGPGGGMSKLMQEGGDIMQRAKSYYFPYSESLLFPPCLRA